MNKNSELWNLDSGLEKPVLLISASDSSAAAGMQADLRILNNLGVPARCAITAVTVQGDGGAKSINPIDPEILLDSINTSLSDSPGIGAVKVGLLGDRLTVEALEAPLSILKELGVPVIVDPVMSSTPGSSLSTEDTVKSILKHIVPLSTLLTPNRDELDELCSLPGDDVRDDTIKIQRLMDLGTGGILVTGGDTKEDQCVDILYGPEDQATVFRHPRIGVKAPRGTGCALSTTIAVHLSRGIPMGEAVGWSIDYVTGLIEQAVTVGEQQLLLPGTRRINS